MTAFKKDALLRYFDLNKQTYIFTDGHKTGLGAILAQGDSMQTAQPVAFASRCTNSAEKNYPQIDLEGMAADYGLRRFRKYLVGSPQDAIIVTDHHPLLSVFNSNRAGSIRTEKIKMRHQDIQYKVVYRKGKENNADFISRHARPWETLPMTEKKEAGELTRFLFTLHVTPVLDAIGIPLIAKETAKDKVLSKLQKRIQDGHTFIPKEDKTLQPFRQIFHEICCLANGTLMKGERIILPESLHDSAIKLAHSGAHPGQNGLMRRLRSHFYIVNLDKKVSKLVDECLECQMFTGKNTNEPIQPNKVPSSCWDEVSVDLFGPMPTSNHIVVIQDLASRFPVAKVVSSTSGKNV